MSYSSSYIFPQEGIDYQMAVIPKGAAISGTVYLGLWGQGTGANYTSWATISGYASASQIAITLNSGTYPVYEVAPFTGYTTRTSLVNGNWGAQTTTSITVPGNSSLPVRYSTYNTPIVFTNGGATASGINGIFLAIGASGTNVGSTSGPSLTVLWYAPFSDYSSITLASGDSISITPTWQIAAFQS